MTSIQQRAQALLDGAACRLRPSGLAGPAPAATAAAAAAPAATGARLTAAERRAVALAIAGNPLFKGSNALAMVRRQIAAANSLHTAARKLRAAKASNRDIAAAQDRLNLLVQVLDDSTLTESRAQRQNRPRGYDLVPRLLPTCQRGSGSSTTKCANKKRGRGFF